MTTFIVSAYLVLVALLLGSFINLAADRLPRGESLISPASHCRACDRRLNFVDLVPVLGYIVRGGRCADCRVPIGVSSPVVEALCGAAMLIPLATLGLARGAVVGFALVGLVGAVAVRALGRKLAKPGPASGTATGPEHPSR
jgi:prepilin signal peptidase PulO-like enzyme (type II secretory pathway)